MARPAQLLTAIALAVAVSFGVTACRDQPVPEPSLDASTEVTRLDPSTRATEQRMALEQVVDITDDSVLIDDEALTTLEGALSLEMDQEVSESPSANTDQSESCNLHIANHQSITATLANDTTVDTNDADSSQVAILDFPDAAAATEFLDQLITLGEKCPDATGSLAGTEFERKLSSELLHHHTDQVVHLEATLSTMNDDDSSASALPEDLATSLGLVASRQGPTVVLASATADPTVSVLLNQTDAVFEALNG